MKSKLIFKMSVLALISLSFIFINRCTPEDFLDHISSFELDKTSLELQVGSSYTLVSTILPANFPDKSIDWTSSAKDIATVDDRGKIVAVKVGKTTITATSKYEKSKSVSCQVTVVDKPAKVAIESIKFIVPSVELGSGTTYSIELALQVKILTIEPSNYVGTLVISSSDETVVKVNPDGTMKVVGTSGTSAVITVSSSADATIKSEITIKVIESATNHITKIKFNQATLNLKKGDVYPLAKALTEQLITIEPIGFNEIPNITSSDPTIVTINPVKQAITVAGEPGSTALVTVSSSINPTIKDVITINVVASEPVPIPVTSVTFNQATLQLQKGTVYSIAMALAENIIAIEPANSTEILKLTSDNESAVKINLDGTMTAVGEPGTSAIITVSSSVNPSIKDQITVTVTASQAVTKPITSIRFNQATKDLNKGEVFPLALAFTSHLINIEPADFNEIPNIISDNPNVVQVNLASQTLTAVGEPGTSAIITVSSSVNPSIKDQITVTVTASQAVTKPITSIRFNQATKDLNKGEVYPLALAVTNRLISIEPIGFNEIPIITSNKPNVVQVNLASQTLTAVGEPGTSAIITVSSSLNPTVKDQITINVTATNSSNLISISLDPAVFNLEVGGHEERVQVMYDPFDYSIHENIVWTSTDESVATARRDVTGFYFITPHTKVGNATITATIQGKMATCAVTVVAPSQKPIESISFAMPIISLKHGDTYSLQDAIDKHLLTITPVGYTEDIKVVSSNTNIVFVNLIKKELSVVGTSGQSATITVSNQNGDKSATLTINVSENLITSITFKETEVLLPQGYKLKLEEAITNGELTISPPDFTETLKITSSDDNIVAVDLINKELTVVGTSGQSATITVSNQQEDKSATLTIKVSAKLITSITFSQTEISLKHGDQIMLEQAIALGLLTISPTDYTETPKVVSSDENVVAVNLTNRTLNVFGTAGQSATITISNQNGDKSATITINVIEPITGIMFAQTEITLPSGTTEYNLEDAITSGLLIISPDGATENPILTSSDNDIIGVDNTTGKLIIKGSAGQFATITVSNQENTIRANIKITIN